MRKTTKDLLEADLGEVVQELREFDADRAEEQILKLKPYSCRYVIGDPVLDNDWRYCGKPRMRGKWRYCKEHYDRCLVPSAVYKKKYEEVA